MWTSIRPRAHVHLRDVSLRRDRRVNDPQTVYKISVGLHGYIEDQSRTISHLFWHSLLVFFPMHSGERNLMGWQDIPWLIRPITTLDPETRNKVGNLPRCRLMC